MRINVAYIAGDAVVIIDPAIPARVESILADRHGVWYNVSWWAQGQMSGGTFSEAELAMDETIEE